MLRTLLTIVVLLAALAVSGLSAAAASAFASNDCCTAECGDGPCSDHRDGDASTTPHGGRGCSPVCHACACAPVFAPPPALHATSVTCAILIGKVGDVASQLPASPPAGDIFHPPRAST